MEAPLQNPDPIINDYNLKGFSFLPIVVPHNINYKAIVGEFIHDYVKKSVGDHRAFKITGMLIDLPCNDIRAYLYDFQKL